MKTKIIYHESAPGVPCSDGIMAAAIALLKYPEAELIGDSYKNDEDYGDIPFGLPSFKNGDKLVIVDFSYPTSWLRYWENNGVGITIIDHHANKFHLLSGFTNAILNKDECGATLTWQYFFPDKPLPPILYHVRRRDIGKDEYYQAEENCRDSKAITAAMEMTRRHHPNKQIQLLQMWLEWDSIHIEELKDIGDKVLEEEIPLIASIAKRAEQSELCGYIRGKIILSKDEEYLTSQIGNKIARDHPEWKFAWLVCSDGGNSLRSSNGFDVSAIARMMGGDGHSAAAGFKEKS